MTAVELARFLGNVIFGTIRFRRGAAASLPTLKDGEPGWTSDTHNLYVGSDAGNILVTGGGGGGSAPSGTGLVSVVNGVYATPANLSGVISSNGYVTTATQQTGTGTIIAMQASPTFTTQIAVPKVIGGTSTSSTLTLQTTTAAGASGADIIFLVGNNGATEAMRILNAGYPTVATAAPGTNTTQVASTAFVTAAVAAVSFSVADDTTDIACFPIFNNSATGTFAPKSNAAFTFDATTANLSCTTFTGALVGNASTASAVAVGGITGLGTGVATALAVNVGSAGAFVTFNGALGTPSSGTVTNLTGTASININGTVGATTPAAGTFTTVQTTGNLTVDGDLLVSGNTVTFDTATITVEDPLIKLAKANAADAVDIGIYGLYVSSGSKYSGLFRDATDGKWKVFTGLQSEPTTTVDTGGTGYAVGTIVANVEGNITGNVTGTASGNALTGAVTGSGLTMATARLLGRTTASSGAIEEITVGSGLSLSAGSLTATGGGGTVTATGGALTANAIVLGAGTTDTKVVAGITTDGTSIITLGVNATTVGKIKLFGDTSGDATIQATSGGSSIVITLPATTGSLATLAGSETLFFKTLSAPKFANGGHIADINGNALIKFTATSSAVNEITLANGATGVGPTFTASGETNVDINFQTKGTGVYNFKATASGPSDLRLFEDTDNGTNYASLIAPASLAGNVVLTLPSTTGTVALTSQITGTAIQSICNGRLTTETGVAVSTSDRASQGTIYWTANADGNQIALYSGSAWELVTFASDISLSLTGLTGSLNFDVFIYNNAGTATLELSAAWTNNTTRADALTTQDGVLVKSGATTRRYVGTIRTSSSNVTEDSTTKRFVWNLYNQVNRPMMKTDTTASWTYTTDTWRQVRATGTNQVEAVVGITGMAEVDMNALSVARNSSAGPALYCGIGEDSTSAIPSTGLIGTIDNPIAGGNNNIWAKYKNRVSQGYHYWAWLERSQATGTSTWFGETSGATRPGIHGTITC